MQPVRERTHARITSIALCDTDSTNTPICVCGWLCMCIAMFTKININIDVREPFVARQCFLVMYFIYTFVANERWQKQFFTSHYLLLFAFWGPNFFVSMYVELYLYYQIRTVKNLRTIVYLLVILRMLTYGANRLLPPSLSLCSRFAPKTSVLSI